VGQNDKYLLTKLKSYEITIDKIDVYLAKLMMEAPANNGLGPLGGQVGINHLQKAGSFSYEHKPHYYNPLHVPNPLGGLS
jgi:hypothetical protein